MAVRDSTRIGWTGVLSLGVLLALPARADAAPETDGPVEKILTAADCPFVLGTGGSHATNAARRDKVVSWVEASGSVVDITHSARWRRPYYLEFDGLGLGETTFRDGAWAAVVDLDESFGCPAGRYQLTPDDNLGGDTWVIAVLPDLVLVEFQGNLAYLLTEDGEAPTWRMVWRSPWKTVRRWQGSVTSVTKGRKNSKRAKRNTKRKRKKRR